MLVNRFDRVPAQAGQVRHLLDRSDMTQVNHEPFQRAALVLLGIGKRHADLLDGPTAFALYPGDPHDHLNLAGPHRQELEAARRLPESNHVTTATISG